jgi:hypothetical protein
MKTATRDGGWARLGLVVVTLAALAACGGGGGGGAGGGEADLIDLTANNRDSVSHAAAASLVVLGASNSIPVLGGPDGVAIVREVARVARKRPLGLIGLPPESCAVSGKALLTLDDLNNNGQLDFGEPVTIIYEACQDNAFNILNGTAIMTITAGTPTSFSATMTMSSLTQEATNGRHGMTLDGSLDLNCATLSSTSMRCTSTASTPVRTTLRTHLFTDTVTLQQGFVEDATYDDGTGHTMSSLRGTIVSTAAGGAFSVSTEATIGRLYADPYPHEGQIRVAGHRGAMLIAPQSATQARIDLDSNDDGRFESSKIEDWDWLL